MKIFHIFSKNISHIVLYVILILICFVSVVRYNYNYERQIQKINSIDKDFLYECEVTSFPTVKTNGKTGFTTKITNCEIQSLCGIKMYVSAKDMSFLPQKGDRLKIYTQIRLPSSAGNDWAFDYRNYLRSQDCAAVCYPEGSNMEILSESKGFLKSIYNIRQHIIHSADKYMPPKNASLLKAVITGDRTGIDGELEEYFKKSGIYHIVAISGLHLNLFVCAVFVIISRIKMKRKKRAVISLITTIITGGFVALMTGVGISVVRALIMLTMFSFASLLPRKPDPKHTLILTAFIIIIVSPYSIYSTSFKLSCLSTLGVLVSADLINYLRDRQMLSFLSDTYIGKTITVSAMTTVFTLPETIVSFGYIPIYSWVANALVIPVMGYFIILGLCFSVSAAVLPRIVSRIFGYALTSLSEYIIKSSELVSNLKYAQTDIYLIYFDTIVLLLAIFIIYWYTYVKYSCKRAIFVIVSFMIIMCSVSLFINSDKDIKITFADVGQGDCTIVEIPNASIMIDCGTQGNKEYTQSSIEAFLRSKNITKIDLAVVTHFHSDHVNIISDLIRKGKISELAIPKYYDFREKEALINKNTLLERCVEANIKVHTIKKGDNISFKNSVDLDVLSPCADMFYDNNNMSAGIRINYGDTRFLILGDAGNNELKTFEPDELKCDFLKIPHHGGYSKECENLIEKTGAKACVISCGVNNVYNHPSDKTLDALRKNGVKIMRTDIQGAVTVKADKNRIKEIYSVRQ